MDLLDDASLLKLAEAEILGEAQRATQRHAIAGPSGWQPIPKTNKSFLVNTLLQTLSSNRIISKKQEVLKVKPQQKTRQRKLLQIQKGRIKDNVVFRKQKNYSKKELEEKNCKMKTKVDRKKEKNEKERKKSKVEK